MRRDERTTTTPQAAEVDPPRMVDPSPDDELTATQEAQRAHGGSMAPDWVDPTGKPNERTAPE